MQKKNTEFLQAMTQSIILKVIESCLVNWICNAIIGAAYPPINEAIGGNGMIIRCKRGLLYWIGLEKTCRLEREK